MLSSFNRTITRNMSQIIKYIGTHDNTFHCDDVTACFMLKQLDRFKNHEIVRTRDPEKLAQAEIVVDVGSELNIEKLRLDHHQHTFQKTMKDFHPNIKTTNPLKPPRLSSSGLVYAIFGKELIAKILKLDNVTDNEQMVDAIFDKAYIEFFEEIDAIDNGVDVASGDNLVYNYHINSGISSRVGRLNPSNKAASDEERLEQFKKAMELVGGELLEGIQFLGQSWWPMRQEFRQFVLKRHEFDPSGQVVRINGDNLLGYKSALMELEEELNIVGQLKYIVYHDPIGTESPWRVTAIPVSLKSFASRAPLKEEWRGKRGEELQKVSGVEDAAFVHMSGFTGGAKSEAGVKKMIRQSLGLTTFGDSSS